jgi:hypothetical protein
LRAVYPTGVQIIAGRISPAPDDDFVASPDRRVAYSRCRYIGDACSHPTVRSRIVSATRIEHDAVRRNAVFATPDDHLAACPHRSVTISASGCVGHAGGCPRVRARIVCTTGVQITAKAPDNHFTAAPDCRVIRSSRRSVGGAGGCPTIRAGIVSPAGVQMVIASVIEIPAPDNHLGTSPNCRVNSSANGRVNRGGFGPAVGAWVVSPAGVVEVETTNSAPNNHLATCPDGGVTTSADWRVGVSRCPSIHDARPFRIRSRCY